MTDRAIARGVTRLEGVPAAARKFLLEPGVPGVFIPAPHCLLLDFHYLNKVRSQDRGVHGSDFDGLLLAIHLAALSAAGTRESSCTGTVVDTTRELAATSERCGASEAADRLDLTKRAVTKAAAAGRLAGTKIDGRWLFTTESLNSFRERRHDRQ